VRARPPRLSLVLLTLALALGACECAPSPSAPQRVAVTSAETVVTLHLAPFAISVAGADGEVASSTTGAPGCAPLALAIRPDDDLGDRYHRPDSPGADLLWFHSRDASLVAENPVTLEVALEGPAGRAPQTATVELRPAAEGFVALDVHFGADARDVAMVSTCFGLETDARVVGGGERFGGVELRGRVIPLAFAAPGPFESGTNESHAPVPFVATSRGLGLLVETERPGAFDVGATEAALVSRFHGGTLSLRLRAGAVLDNAAAHARLMGLPPRPPRWALAPQLWRNENAVSVDVDGTVLSTGQDRLLDDAQRLRDLGIPTTTLWIDAPWETGYNTFELNPVQFPDPDAMFAQLEALGFRVIVWATEYVNTSDDSADMIGMPPDATAAMFAQYRDAGYLVLGSDGAPWQFSWGRGYGGFVDFTNPAAATAFTDLARPLVARGVRGFKLDYGETMRPDLLGMVHNEAVSFSDGSASAVQHTRYARLYHEAFIDLVESEWPGDWFIITRTGGIYDQGNGVTIWPGDLDNDFTRHGEAGDDGALNVGGLPAAISGALSLALSGYPLYGSDIGGYRGGAPTTEALLRWAQFEALTPVMQLGGGGTGDTTHNPCDDRYDPEAVAIYRRYARLHMDLLPTFEALVARAGRDGTPPIAPLGLLAGDDAAAWSDAEAFALGDALLVYPVVEAGATTRQVRLPPGEWLGWWDDALLVGASTTTAAAPLDTLPLYVRAGAVIWMGDPRLDTAVDASEPTVGDPATYGAALVVRTSPGATHVAALADGGEASQETVGDTTTVMATATGVGRLTLDLRLRDDLGPGPAASVAVEGMTFIEVSDQQEIWDCAQACLWRGSSQLLATVPAAAATFRVQGR